VIKTVDSFYLVYEPLLKYLEGTINVKKDNDQFYFHILENTTKNSGPFFDLINGIKKSPQVFYILSNLNKVQIEKKIIQQNLSPALQNLALDLHDDYRESQEQLIGKLTKTFLNKYIVDLNNSFKQMSYLKLEVLSRKKGKLYRGESLVNKRGDVKYLKRTRQQYFWSFKNEFWADELGDYVFALASECKK